VLRIRTGIFYALGRQPERRPCRISRSDDDGRVPVLQPGIENARDDGSELENVDGQRVHVFRVLAAVLAAARCRELQNNGTLLCRVRCESGQSRRLRGLLRGTSRVAKYRPIEKVGIDATNDS